MGNVQNAASAHEVLWRHGTGWRVGRPWPGSPRAFGPVAFAAYAQGVLSRREAILLGVLALLVHGAVIYWVNQTADHRHCRWCRRKFRR